MRPIYSRSDSLVDNLCNYAINTGVLTRYDPSFLKKRPPIDTDLQHRQRGHPNFSKFRLVNSSPIFIDGGEWEVQRGTCE